MRLAAKRDANEPPLIALAVGLGADWHYAGPLDGWLHSAGTGWVPVEIKNGKNPYTEAQKRFIARCIERGRPFLTWRTETDVLVSLGAQVTAGKAK